MIFFFYGPNGYASRQEVERLVAAYVAKTGSDLGLERLDGETINPKTVAASLQAVPFLTTSRLVVVSNLGANKTASELVLGLLDEIPSSTVVIFRETAVDQRTRWFKELSATAKTVKFDLLAPAKLAAWARQEAQNLGGQMDREAAVRLVELVGDDQWRLVGEVGKLVNYEADSRVTRETVDLLVEATIEQSIFAFVDLVVEGKTAPALAAYKRLLELRTNEIYILSMVIWQLRNLLLAKTAGPMSARELAGKAKLSPFVAEKAQVKARRLDLEQLKTAFQAAVETDYQIKSGVAAADILVEKLVYQLSAKVLAARS